MTDSPYVSARREWNSHASSLMVGQRMWQAVASLSLCLNLVLAGGMIYISDGPDTIPYIVEVDALGQVRNAGPLKPVANIDTTIIQWTVRDYIAKSRMVTQDRVLQSQAIYSVYGKMLSSSPALKKMEAYMRGHGAEPSLEEKRQKASVSVDIIGVLNTASNVWQVDWKEHFYSLSGELTDSQLMRATLTVEHRATQQKDLKNNPLSIYIHDFDWTRMDL